MSENAMGNKSTELICKNIRIGKILVVWGIRMITIAISRFKDFLEKYHPLMKDYIKPDAINSLPELNI